MNPRLLDYLAPIALLIGSNVFMTFAWHGHLKFTNRPLWLVIAASWGIRLPGSSRWVCSTPSLPAWT